MNIFEVLGANYEVFHSRMLAWLLNPCGSHEAGDRFLQHLLERLNIPCATATVATEVQVHVPNAQRWRLADVVIRTQQYFVLIENKVDPLYQDVQQIVEEIAGGIALAQSENRIFKFVYVAPGPLAPEVEAAIGAGGHFVSWQSLVEGFSPIETSDIAANVASTINQYFEFCRARFVSKVRTKAGSPIGDDSLLAQVTAALRDELQQIAPGMLVTAVDLWNQFCERYPDHVSRLESRWSESSHYSAKSWFASRLQQFASKRDLIEDTGEWKHLDVQWGFPRVRIYRRLADD